MKYPRLAVQFLTLTSLYTISRNKTWMYSISANESLKVTASPASVDATFLLILFDRHRICDILASSPFAIRLSAKHRACAPCDDPPEALPGPAQSLKDTGMMSSTDLNFQSLRSIDAVPFKDFTAELAIAMSSTVEFSSRLARREAVPATVVHPYLPSQFN